MSECTDPDLGALLHAYELHALSDRDTELFEIHLLKCEYCFNEVKQFESSADVMREDDDVKEIVTASVEEDRESAPWAKRLWQHLWPKAPFVFRPALAYLLIVIMAIPAYHGLRYAARDDKQIRPLQAITLVSGRSTQEAVLKISSDRDGTISFHFSGAVPGKSYRVVIEAEEGKEVVRYDNFDVFDKYGMGELFFPLTKMRPGEYRLIIIDPSVEYPPNTREYWFKIEE
jgi:hypothetical protein